MEDTNLDMMNLTKNLRDEMKLARKLSFRRIDQVASLKAPPGHIQYPHIEDELGLEGPSAWASIQRYPSLAEVSKLPSSRHFSKVLDEEFHDTPRKMPASTTIHEEDHSHDDASERTAEVDNLHPMSPFSPSSSSPSSLVDVEIFPGVFKHLRGSKETQEAWECGRCAQMPCVVCEAEMAFVWDCEFVICPCCKAVVPVDANESGLSDSMPSLQSSMSSFLSETETTEIQRQGGVGLGIRIL